MSNADRTFRELHIPGHPFILANAWDVGSARMLAALGAQALATSSAAHAFTLGMSDGDVSRDQALAHAQDLVAATSLPVQGDFENGWGDGPDAVAETVRMSAEVGLAGICIEDVLSPDGTAYDRDLAVERIAAGAAAARALPGDFVFCARADGVMTGVYDLDEALARIRAFDDVGADVLYVPLPGDLDALARVVAVTAKPVNMLAVGPLAQHSKSELAKAGVARISLGSALARVTHRAIADAATAMFRDGDFTPLTRGIGGQEVDVLLKAAET